MRRSRGGWLVAIAGGIAAVAAVAAHLHAEGRPLPPRLDGYLTKHVKLSPAQRSQLLAGHPVRGFGRPALVPRRPLRDQAR